MLSNSNDPESEEASAVVERFRNSKSPAILVSPSFGTGWDFPGFDCEWQIITNIPFPPMISKVMKRRKELDPGYQAAQAAKELGQALGRPMRFEKDRAETFIVDDRIGWFEKIAKKYLPEDFAYTSLLKVPSPGPRWNER
jgi:Rad3-related DNA helicase